jgi:predicted ArsR family transcriptional regulator
VTVKTTSAEGIVKVLSRRKTPVTKAFIAEKTGINPRTVYRTLYDLTTEGKVSITGTVQSGKVGRPANLYLLTQ